MKQILRSTLFTFIVLAFWSGLGFGVTTKEEPETLPLMQKYGLLRLNVQPGEAETIIDGRFLDKNVWLISMKPGKHHIAIQKDGFQVYEKSFEISNGDRLTFDVKLEPLQPEG